MSSATLQNFRGLMLLLNPDLVEEEGQEERPSLIMVYQPTEHPLGKIALIEGKALCSTVDYKEHWEGHIGYSDMQQFLYFVSMIRSKLKSDSNPLIRICETSNLKRIYEIAFSNSTFIAITAGVSLEYQKHFENVLLTIDELFGKNTIVEGRELI